MWFSCKLGLLGASLSPNAHGKQTARCWGEPEAAGMGTTDWACFMGQRARSQFGPT